MMKEIEKINTEKIVPIETSSTNDKLIESLLNSMGKFIKEESKMEEVIKTPEEILLWDMRKLIEKGFSNPSAITAILFQKEHKGRFMEVRKTVIFELQQYQMNKNKT